MSNTRKPTAYLKPDPDQLPPDSVLNAVRVGNTVKPPPHLMRIFSGYVDKQVINPTDLPMISFEEFGSKWLPLFNYGAHEDHTQIPLMDWVEEVSGSPYREVRLIRDGYEVARIPALFDRLIPVMKEDERDYFANIAAVQSVIHRGGNHINEADGFIKRNITDRIEVKKALSANFHRMSAIFNLYGVEREVPEWITELENYEGKKDPVMIETKTEQSFTSGMVEED